MTKTKNLRLRSKLMLMTILTIITFVWFVFMTLSVIDVNNELENFEISVKNDRKKRGSALGPFHQNPVGHLIPKLLTDKDEDLKTKPRQLSFIEEEDKQPIELKNKLPRIIEKDVLNDNHGKWQNIDLFNDDDVVKDDKLIKDDILVKDDVVVKDDAVFRDEVVVKDDVVVQDDAVVKDDAEFKDDVVVKDDAAVKDDDVVKDDAVVKDDVVKDEARGKHDEVVKDYVNAKNDSGMNKRDLVKDAAIDQPVDIAADANNGAEVKDDAVVKDVSLLKDNVLVKDNAKVKDRVNDRNFKPEDVDDIGRKDSKGDGIVENGEALESDKVDKDNILDDIHDGNEAQREPVQDDLFDDLKDHPNVSSDNLLHHDKPRNDRAFEELFGNDQAQNDTAADDLPIRQDEQVQNDQVAEKALSDRNGLSKENRDMFHLKLSLNDREAKLKVSMEANKTSLLWNDWPIELLPSIPDFDTVKKIINYSNAGDGGTKFDLNTDILPKTERRKVDKARKKNGMNEYVSNLIGLRRNLTERRPKGCAERYPATDNLPQTSIIICFVNEAWSTLLRTVHSVLNNSPAHLLKEIILVDDGSTWDFLGDPLEEYMSRYPKVKILRTSGVGLMKARMLGYNHTTAPAVTFLDSHIECAKGWLEPLLHPLAVDPMIVVTPVIAAIDKRHFEFASVSEVQVGIVSFPYLLFSWRCQPPREVLRRNGDVIGNVRSPAMAGGLFSITKKFFDSLGQFDPAMKAWGGENIEMSFKVWMCGGRIEVSPCSIVGHVFHSHDSYTKLRPTGGTDYHINLVRTAHVWMRGDADKHYAEYNTYKHAIIAAYAHTHRTHVVTERQSKSYTQNDDAIKSSLLQLIGDVSERIQIRDGLQCKDFRWYIENINPEAALPGDGVYSGQIRSLSNTSICLGSQRFPKTLEAQPCSSQPKAFDMTDLGEIVTTGKCMQRKRSLIVFELCNWFSESFIWKYEDTQIKGGNKKCISITTANEIVLEECSDVATQKWQWEYKRPRRRNVLHLEDVRNLRH